MAKKLKKPVSEIEKKKVLRDEKILNIKNRMNLLREKKKENQKLLSTNQSKDYSKTISPNKSEIDINRENSNGGVTA